MKTIANYLMWVLLVSSLAACGSGDESIECGQGTALEAESGTVCVFSGELLIETGFSCPAELHYQHQYAGWAVCSSRAELGDDVIAHLDAMQTANNTPGGACVNVMCRLGESCVAGRCVADPGPGCVGEVCGAVAMDRDGDGVIDARDNCPGTPNPDQRDSDGDGLGDHCDAPSDSDSDGVYDRHDNCPRVANPTQSDVDLDGVGDVCDDCDSSDHDRDGLSACDERHYGTSDSSSDTDSDGLSDATEVRLGSDPLLGDTDGDGVGDGAELRYGLSPLSASTFKDGTGDGARLFLADCESDTLLLERTVMGSDALTALLPQRVGAAAVTVVGANSSNRRAAWTFEDLRHGVSGFVVSHVKPTGVTPFEHLADTLGSSQGIVAFEAHHGRDAAIVRGMSAQANRVSAARDEALAAFAPFAALSAAPLAGEQRPAGSVLVIDDGNDFIVMGAFSDTTALEAESSATWLEHVVAERTLQPAGATRTECRALGQRGEARPIDLIVVVDPTMSDAARVDRVRHLLPIMRRRLASGSEAPRIGFVPMSSTWDPQHFTGWKTSLAEVAAAFDEAVTCSTCSGGASYDATQLAISALTTGATNLSVRPDAVVGVVVVSDDQPSEAAGVSLGLAQQQAHDFSAYVSSQVDAVAFFGQDLTCPGTSTDWLLAARFAGGVTSGLCDDRLGQVADDFAVGLVAEASPFEVPAGAAPSSIRFYRDNTPLDRSRTEGFYLRGDLGKVAFFGPNRPGGPATGRAPVISYRADVHAP